MSEALVTVSSEHHDRVESPFTPNEVQAQFLAKYEAAVSRYAELAVLKAADKSTATEDEEWAQFASEISALQEEANEIGIPLYILYLLELQYLEKDVQLQYIDRMSKGDAENFDENSTFRNELELVRQRLIN
jgi:hypothetical protein